MKINRRLQNISLIAVAGLAFIGLILGTFLDRQITNRMGDYDNVFGIAFTALGPILTLAFGVFAGATLFFMPKIKNKTWDIVFRVIGAFAIIGFVFAQIKEGKAYADPEFLVMQKERSTWIALIIVLISLIDLAIVLFTKIWIKKMDTKVLIQVCLMIIAIIVIYFVVCEAIKYMASRPRPRVLDQGRLYFKQWYEWKPFAAFKEEYDDCKSFVSGHAANAGCLVTILPLIATLNKRENNEMIQILTSVIGALFVFVVAFSRIIAKAHWLSDVMGGILVSCGIQALVINLTPYILKKTEKPAEE